MIDKRKFTVIKNNGKHDRYHNSCIWICVSDFLKYVKGINIQPIQLRESSSFTDRNIFFDFMNTNHRESLQEICDVLKIGIDFHYVNIQSINNRVVGMWIGNPVANINAEYPNKNRMAVACYGDHFELIISKTVLLKSKKTISDKMNDDNKVVEEYKPFTSTDTNGGKSLAQTLQNDNKYLKKLIDITLKETQNIKLKLNKCNSIYDDIIKRHKSTTRELNRLKVQRKKCNKQIITNKIENKPHSKYVMALNIIDNNESQYNQILEKLDKRKQRYDTIIKNTKNHIETYNTIKNEYSEQIKQNNKTLKILS